MQLQDIENVVLYNLQQSELVNFGTAPNWAAAVNPAIPKAALDFFINRAYMRVIQDLSDFELALYRFVFPSQSQISDYPLPPLSPPGEAITGSSILANATTGVGPAANPLVWGSGVWGQATWGSFPTAPGVQRITRIIYSPVGQQWAQDYEGGVRLVSWAEFNRRTGFGYLRPFTYGIMPDFASVQPQRNVLSFFPGSANPYDTIGVEYIPKLTPNSDWPPLLNETDTPNMPEETHDLICIEATRLQWIKLREIGMMEYYAKLYLGTPEKRYEDGELWRVGNALKDRSKGDTLCIRDANDGIALSYLVGGALIP